MFVMTVAQKLFLYPASNDRGWWFAAVMLLLALSTIACQQSPTVEVRLEPSPTLVQPTLTPNPTEGTAQVVATATLLPVATANLTPPAVAIRAESGSDLVIDSFEIIAAENMDTGKKVTLSWRSNGQSARLFSDIGRTVPAWWQIPASGTITVELEDPFYADPPFTLQVFDTSDPIQASEAVEISLPFQWPCNHSYFFEPAPALCPASLAIESSAAEQPFEGGVMIWLEFTESVYIFDRDDSSWRRFDDTWSEEQPESDPAIVPPAGLFQPIRGFGKVWRENPEIREKLGWALGPELGFESILQEQKQEIPDLSVFFIKTFNGQIFALTDRGLDQGDWVIATS